MNAEGDQGLHTNAAGPVLAEIDLDPDDFDDLIQSAIGFGGYGWCSIRWPQLKWVTKPSGTDPYIIKDSSYPEGFSIFSKSLLIPG